MSDSAGGDREESTRDSETGQRTPAPAAARLLLSLVLAPRDRAVALADLEEELEERTTLEGARGARRWYWRQAWGSVVPALLQRTEARASRLFTRRPSEGRSRNLLEVSMLGLAGDVRVAIRNHRRTPIASTVTVLSLGLGIGAVAVVVALLQQFVFPAPTGYGEPERLATLYTSRTGGGLYGLSSYEDFLDLRGELVALDDLAATTLQFRGLVRGSSGSAPPAVEPLIAEGVSGNYFGVAGITPVLGRGIQESDVSVDDPLGGAEPVVVLGHDLWTTRFASDPEIVGREIRLDGAVLTVVGVAPDGLVSRRTPLEVDVWIPLGLDAQTSPGRYTRRSQRSLVLFGRLRRGATVDELHAQAQVVASRLAREHPRAWSDASGDRRRLTAVSERDSRLNPRVRRLLVGVGLFLLGASGLVLLLACSNAASLFLSRAAARSREMAIRRSLGSTGGRLVRLWLLDGLLPGLAAGALGLVVVQLTRTALASFSLPVGVPVDLALDLEPSLFLIVFALAVGTSAVFALAGAMAGARSPLSVALRRGPLERRRRRLLGRSSARELPVLAQCAAALVLLVGATLFVRATRSSAIDLGFDPSRVAIASTFLGSSPNAPASGGAERRDQRARELVETLEASPGVEGAAIARRVELTVMGIDSRFEVTAVDSRPLAEGRRPVTYWNSVSPGYLEMLDVELVAGRAITAADRPGAPPVVVVNQTLAERLWPGGEAVGRQLTLREPPSGWEPDTTPRRFEVVGVARDGRYVGIDVAGMSYVWLSLAQEPPEVGPDRSEVVVLAKGRADATSMLPLLREVVSLDSGQIQQIPTSTLEEQVALQLLPLRVAFRVLAWGGAFGLFLAALGIYGIVALSVQQRRRELAIRVAVGARRSQVLGSALGGSTRLVLLGLALGLCVAVPLAGLLRGVLAQVDAPDPMALLPAVGLLLGASFVASIGPAFRAARGRPLDALREE